MRQSQSDKRLSQDVFEVGAVVFSAAIGAVGSHPNLVELVGNRANHLGVGGDDTGLEIAAFFGFGTHAGTSEVGAAGIGEAAVNDHALEIYTNIT